MNTLIGYVGRDEVNRQSAARAAEDCGATLIDLSRPFDGAAGRFDALIHDLDHVDAGSAAAIIGELLSRPALVPVAVHGYNLDDDEIAQLDAHGVVVARRFDPELIRALCRAHGRSPTATPEPPDSTSQEATDDPAVFCGMVRTLATDTHRAAHSGAAATSNGIACGIAELREGMSQLQQQLDRFRGEHKLAFEDLQRWLDSLRRCVEAVLADSPRGAEE